MKSRRISKNVRDVARVIVTAKGIAKVVSERKNK